MLLQQIAIAHFLERSQIVRSSENYRLDVMSNDWWGEPLGAMLSRVLIEELGQRLPQSTVIADNGAVSARPDATIELNIQRLDEDAAGNLILQAQVARAFYRAEPARPCAASALACRRRRRACRAKSRRSAPRSAASPTASPPMLTTPAGRG